MNKKVIAIVLFLLVGTLTAAAQTVNGKAISEIDVEYVEIVRYNKKKKVIVKVDFGQEKDSRKSGLIKNKNGNNKEFNSIVDALNFMSKNGYDFVNAYSVTVSDDRSVTHYLLRKRKD